MSREDLLVDRIHQLEEEIRILHLNDKTIQAILVLDEISASHPLTADAVRYSSQLGRDLIEGERRKENFYLRQRVRTLEKEVKELRG